MGKYLLGIVLLLTGIFSLAKAQLPPKREFRAVWIATVENIDWPSRKGLPVETQKQEYINLLDKQQRNGMNAVIVQIRPVADAFYDSPFEPWSEYITGTQGQAPNPYYDPLRFMLEETHKRGMEFHAWFNPYRAAMSAGRHVTPNHITRMRPQWFVTFDGKKYFDPGIPEAREYVNQIIRDVVRRYDIDAVHFDDYFYPYPVPGREFGDFNSYRQYGRNMQKDDWRRWNVDTIIQMVSKTIKEEKPWVKFGISPFGIWRNKNKDPEGSYSTGLANYDDLYADVLKWLKNGWIDYVAPQLYWERGHRVANYELLLNWWAQHGYGRNVYIGHGVYRLRSSAAWSIPNELPVQITETRTLNTIHGSAFYSAKSFNGNPLGFEDSLRNHFYHYPALRPTMPWINLPAPFPPYFTDAFERADGLHLHWVDDDTSGRTQQYVIYRFNTNESINLTDPTKILAIVQQMPDPQFIDLSYVKGNMYTYVITALNRLQTESWASEPLYMRISGKKTQFIFEPE
jgi:uncharacterized lipoprotein YddW (UPF0748 family)